MRGAKIIKRLEKSPEGFRLFPPSHALQRVVDAAPHTGNRFNGFHIAAANA